jgi:RNase adaptor protein for sRNA GlmZ degradation
MTQPDSSRSEFVLGPPDYIDMCAGCGFGAWRDGYPCSRCGGLESVRFLPEPSWEERMKWVRAFNSLEKPVTNHIERCMDADDLERAHRAVMREYGPNA